MTPFLLLYKIRKVENGAINMLRSKYHWQNDFSVFSATGEKELERNIMQKPKLKYLEIFQFSQEIIEPIATCIFEHIEKKSTICICGDYDVDGMTATTILYKALSKIGADVMYVIPNRFVDGYGITPGIIEALPETVGLIITVDNGISAHPAVELAREKQLDIIITDHHARGGELPPATHILHPELDETLETTAICGAAVAFCLAKALLVGKKEELAVLYPDFLQLVAMATLADMMPLDVAFNRTITYGGFQQMKKNPLKLIKAFGMVLKIERLKSDDLSFQMIPRMNAVGRLGDANVVVEALLEEDMDALLAKITTFNSINEERKKIGEAIFDEIIEKHLDDAKNGFFLAYSPNWHQGVLGIVAQKVMQKLQRPVILLAQNSDDANKWVGSARAYGPYNVKACFDVLAANILKYGGHTYAGGLTVTSSELESFSEALVTYNQQLNQEIEPELEKIPLIIDGWKKFEQLDTKFLAYQESFEPFGENNKPFVIGVHKARLVEIQVMGKGKQHLKLIFEENKRKYPVLAFYSAHLLEELAVYAKVDIIVQCQKNYFNGMEQLQYLLVDIQTLDKQIFDYRNIRFMNQDIELKESTIIINEIPLDVTAFFEISHADYIEKIYLKYMQHEDFFMYATTIEKNVFGYVYKYLQHMKTIDLNDEKIYMDMYQKKIPKSVFLYIIRVFFELNFVIIKDNTCKIAETTEKLDLNMSKSYQELAEWLVIRNVILFEPVDKLYRYLAKNE